MAEGYEPQPVSAQYNGNGVDDDITNATRENPYTAPSDGYVMIFLNATATNGYVELAAYQNGWAGMTAMTSSTNRVMNSMFIRKGGTIYIINNTVSGGKVYFRGIK